MTAKTYNVGIYCRLSNDDERDGESVSMHKYEAERAEKSEAIPELERKVKSYLENRTDANRWLAIIRRYTEITELDESILFELVDRIEVGETQKVGGQRICDLRVYYRYVGNVDAALVQEERRQPLEEAI